MRVWSFVKLATADPLTWYLKMRLKEIHYEEKRLENIAENSVFELQDFTFSGDGRVRRLAFRISPFFSLVYENSLATALFKVWFQEKKTLDNKCRHVWGRVAVLAEWLVNLRKNKRTNKDKQQSTMPLDHKQSVMSERGPVQ